MKDLLKIVGMIFVALFFLQFSTMKSMQWFCGCCSSKDVSSEDVSEIRNKASLQKMLYSMLILLPKELIALIVEYDSYELQGILFKAFKINPHERIMIVGKLGPNNVISISKDGQVRLFDIEAGTQVFGYKLCAPGGFIHGNGRLLIINSIHSSVFEVWLHEAADIQSPVIAHKNFLPYQRSAELPNGWLAECKDNGVIVVTSDNKVVKKIKHGTTEVDCCHCADDGSLITANQLNIAIWR